MSDTNTKTDALPPDLLKQFLAQPREVREKLIEASQKKEIEDRKADLDLCKTEVDEVCEKWETSFEELAATFYKPTKRASVAHPVLIRDPDNPGNVWTGIGSPIRWLREKAGKDKTWTNQEARAWAEANGCWVGDKGNDNTTSVEPDLSDEARRQELNKDYK